MQHLRRALRVNADNSGARNLAVIVLRKLGQYDEAATLLRETLEMDPLDSWACYLSEASLPADNQILLDLAFDHARGGLFSDAMSILSRADIQAKDGSVPMVLYATGYFRQQAGEMESARAAYAEASSACRDYCFPKRLEEMLILEAALQLNPEDDAAAYYLGNLLYDRRRHREAIVLWERAASRNSSYSVVWRNLGIGYFNVTRDSDAARCAFEKALQANSGDARVLFERDQLWK